MGNFIINTPFGFGLDFSFWADFFSQPAGEIIKGAFCVLLWWMLVFFIFKKILNTWLKEKQTQYTKDWRWVVLAVDVPPIMIQSPKAVEQIFVHLSGSFMKINLLDKYIKGKMQKWFSFEIISIDGYIQFLVRTEVEFRDLVEAAIYAQYTEAEITEVEDYTLSVPDKYPNDQYDVVGAELNLAQNEAYPIRTYPHFEYANAIEKEMAFTDPMAAILENFTRIGPGENFWLQLVVTPSDNSWKEGGIELVKEIIEGKKKAPPSGLATKAAELPINTLKTAVKAWNMDFSGGGDEKKEESVPKISDLTPGKRAVVEAVEEKISKFGFKSKMRVLYAAKKTVFNPQKCLYGFIGASNQFYTADKNSLAPDMMKDEGFVGAFKKRALKYKTDPYILNIEELATLWHFPLPTVKTPLLQKTSLKRSEPPIDLPVDLDEGIFGETEGDVPVFESKKEELPYG